MKQKTSWEWTEFPAVQRLYADGTGRNHQHNSAYLWNEVSPWGFRYVPRLFYITPGRNQSEVEGGLCRLLLDYIQNEQVKWLDFYCSIQDINHFTKQDIELGIPFSLCDKSSGDPKFSDQGTMTCNTELCNKWTQTEEVIMNIPGVWAVFSSPW